MSEVTHINNPRRFLAGDLDAARGGFMFPSAATPVPAAKAIYKALYVDEQGLPTVIYWQSRWWRYAVATGWVEIGESEIRADLYQVLEHASAPGQGEGQRVPWNPTKRKLTDVIDAMQTMRALGHPISNEAAIPCWLTNAPGRLPASEYVPMANGLLHLPTRRLSPATPARFSTWQLPYNFDTEAECPTWLAFLDQIWAHDPKAALALQEWAGYLISGRLDLQKALLVIGPPRAGKGVMTGVLAGLVGQRNFLGIKMKDFIDDYGMMNMPGKQFCVVSDARGSRKGGEAISEQILTLTGCDWVQVKVKYEAPWSGVLPTRLAIFSNELPVFMDASNAVTTRFICAKMKLGFLGKEDPTLPGRLKKEMPGIFLWALEGLTRLEQQGRFTEPDTMAEMVEEMNELASPVTAFLHECYTLTGDPDDKVVLDDVFKTYKSNEDPGIQVRSKNELARKINAAALPGVATKRVSERRPDGSIGKVNYLVGVVVRPASQWPAWQVGSGSPL